MMSDSKAPPSASGSASALLSLLSLLGGATAYKDSDYWPPGESNPLANEKMYWKDSINVLQDLSSFKALYVQYHNCVWSKYGSRYGKGSDYEEEDDDYENGCVGNGYGGENYWYLGRTQCFRANAAFALYGVLNDDDEEVETDSDGTYCHKGTYINSFFSTYGAESFAGPLGLDTDSVNSYCTTNEPDNEDYMYDYDNADDDFTPYNYKAWTSYGIGCLDGKFVQDKYQGAFCHGSNYIATMDTLDSYNSALESAASCVQIYSYGQQEGSGDEDDDDDEDDGDIDFTEKSTLAVLKYSKACSVRQYPEACPDPHGLKEHYAQVWNRYLYKTGAGAPGRSAAEDAERVAWGVGAAALVVGAALLLCARRTRRRTALKPRGTTITPITPVKKKTSFGFPKRKRRSNRGGSTPGGSTPPLTPPNSAGDDVDGGGEGDEYKTALKGPAEAQAQAQAQGAPSPTIRVHSEPLKKTHSLGYRISSSVRNAKLAFQKYAEEEVEVDADVVDDTKNFSKVTQRGYVADAYAKTNNDGDVPRTLEMVDRTQSGATAGTAPSVLTNTDRSAAGSSSAAARSSSSARAAGVATATEKPSDAAAGAGGDVVPFDEDKASAAAAADKPDDVHVDVHDDNAASAALSSVRASAARAREAAAAAAVITPVVSEVVTPATTRDTAASPTSAAASVETDTQDGSSAAGVLPPAPAPEPDAPVASVSPTKEAEAEAAAAAASAAAASTKEGKDGGDRDREEDLPAIIKSAPSHDTNAEDVAVEMEDVPMVAPSAPSSAPASPAAARDQTSPAAAAARDQTSPAAAAVAAREEAEAKATADAVLAEMGAVSSPSPVSTPHPAAAAVAYPDSTFSSGGKSSSDGNIGKKKRKKKRPLLNKLSKSLFGPSKRTQQV